MRGKAETMMMNLLVSRSVLEKKISYSTRDKDMTLEDLEDMTPQIQQAARTHFTKFRNTITYIVRIA